MLYIMFMCHLRTNIYQNKHSEYAYIFFFGWILCRTNTVDAIWRLSSFTGGGRPQVPLRALFQARVGT